MNLENDDLILRIPAIDCGIYINPCLKFVPCFIQRFNGLVSATL
jgi:hypothetical protein